MSYEEANSISDYVGRGLRMLGQPSNSPLCIFADTRAEWMMTAQACFKQSFPVVTLYTNLGEEAIAHGLNETEVETVITSHELLPKFKSILKSTPHVKTIIYYENPIKKTDVSGNILGLVEFWILMGSFYQLSLLISNTNIRNKYVVSYKNMIILFQVFVKM